LRAGELTAVWVPDQAHEAMRDLVRGRIAVMHSVRRARQQLQGFLLRQDLRYPGPTKKSWTKSHREWLRSLTFSYPAHHVLVHELLHLIEEGRQRQQRIEQQIQALLPTWSMAPIVRAIQAMRGVSLIAALTLAAEIGDFRQRACTPSIDRRRVGLPTARRSQQAPHAKAGQSADADQRDRVGCPTAAVRAVSQARSKGQM
jgi:transposase